MIRGRLLGSEPVRRWALAFPPTRWIARRRARKLFDLCAGFVYSQVLVACVRADLFAMLRAEARDAPEIAAALHWPADATDLLLRAATALRLLRRRRDGRYALGPLGAAVAAEPGIAAMVAHHHLLYADLADPVALLRDGPPEARLAAFWPYDDASPSKEPSDFAPYTALMATSQAMVARQVLAAAPFASFRKLLDIGGGDGTFLRAVSSHHPHLRLALFDLPAVAGLARRAFAVTGTPLEVAGGDFRSDALPDGADIVSLVRVLHDHDDADAARILRNVRTHIRPGGTVLIAEPMAGIAGAERVGSVYFPFYLRAMGRGRTRTPAQYEAMLREAGFHQAASPSTPLPIIASVLLARAAP